MMFHPMLCLFKSKVMSWSLLQTSSLFVQTLCIVLFARVCRCVRSSDYDDIETVVRSLEWETVLNTFLSHLFVSHDELTGIQAQHKLQLDERDRHPNIVVGTPFPPDLAPEIMPTFTGHPAQGVPAQGVPVGGGAASQPAWSQPPPPGYPTTK